MINPVTQLLMTKRAELNTALAYHELQFKRGEISFEEYSSEDVYRVSEPKGLLGIIVKMLRKLF